ncbi:GNAT family N-acetyltransferase [Paenibacillus sp. GCM10027628]|uniref:GNAT family N-acetyltransferase n=1 Tax=Paenibacillus sp. GCM10027628 TaxID=3273413 RepID=UPI0036334F51
MIIDKQDFLVNGISYTIRSATEKDAKDLSALRLQIDGETENLDREKGEAFIDIPGFEQIIKTDTENRRNLFLVAVVDDRIVGYSRCEGNQLNRFAHKIEFGVGVLGFEIEGILKNDKILSDGKYYNTIIMGRFNE